MVKKCRLLKRNGIYCQHQNLGVALRLLAVKMKICVSSKAYHCYGLWFSQRKVLVTAFHSVWGWGSNHHAVNCPITTVLSSSRLTLLILRHRKSSVQEMRKAPRNTSYIVLTLWGLVESRTCGSKGQKAAKIAFSSPNIIMPFFLLICPIGCAVKRQRRKEKEIGWRWEAEKVWGP